ncbi:MAG: VWA domain-containing protein [Planctomycetales bacterium]
MPTRTTRTAIMGLSVTLALCVAQAAKAEQAPQAKVLQYSAESGDAVQAVLLQAPKSADTLTVRDHIVLVDTSASQNGGHRVQALATLDAFLANLADGSRFRLFAVDVAPEELTQGLTATKGKLADRARALLARRAPLGATDLGRALQTALASAKTAKNASVVYIGDGVSGLRLIPTARMQTLVDGFRAIEVPVSSYAIGPRRDLQLLGVLANWTGGNVVLDDGTTDARILGGKLAQTAEQTVVYPSSVSVQPVGTTLLPATALPIRGDRATVYLTRGTAPTSLVAKAATGEVRWSVDSASSNTDNAFLATLVQRVEHSPVNAPFAGEQLLTAAKDAFLQRIDQLSALGDAALLDRDLNQAAEYGKAIHQLDPSNEQATRLAKSAAKFQTISQVSQPADPNAATADATTQQQPGSLIAEIEVLQAIKTQQFQSIVARTIQEVRRIAEEDPDAALSTIKRAIGAVKAAEDIDPDQRIALAKRLQGVLADVKGQKEVAELRSIRAQERVAAIEAQRRLIDDIAIDDDRLERLIDNVRSLIETASHGEPDKYLEAEAVSEEAVNLQPGNGVATAAQVVSEASGQLYTAFFMRSLRADRFLETLEQVERSHVPFPDEPPIRWPRPEVWKALTERRRQYASVDLHKATTAERRITAALDDQTTINFADTPLTDVVDYLSRTHEIPIILDVVAIEEAGLLVDEPVNLVLAGITLQSALKIMLSEFELTYVIEDEVMKITTVEVAAEILSTRVYPVGDLVVDLNALSLGGGASGQLGGGGGQGGGQQGGGGGQQGGQGGGGAFSITPPKLPKGMSQQKSDKAAPVKQPADPELRGILDGILNEAGSNESTSTEQISFEGYAQVKPPVFRLDNKSIEELKKKR